MSKSLSATVIYGSVRDNRQGIRVAKFVTNELSLRGHKVTLIDALERQIPLMTKMYKEYKTGEAPDWLEKLADIHRQTDAYVIVTGEYNHSIQPGLGNALFYFLEEYFYKTAGIISYSAGTISGMRAAVHLRAVVAELGLISIPTMIGVPTVSSSVNEDGTLAASGTKLKPQFDKFAQELEWYAWAIKNARLEGLPK